MDRVIKRPKFGSEHRPAQDQALELFPDFTTVHEAFEAAQVGVWSWDLATVSVNWSSNLAALHGLPPRGFDGSYAGFLKVINEEDRAAVNAALQEAVQKHGGFRTRYRVAHSPSSGERWLATSGAVFVEGGAAKITSAFVLVPLSLSIIKPPRARKLLLAGTTVVPVLLWYLWAGPLSPMFGKDKMATFEIYFIEDHPDLKLPVKRIAPTAGSLTTRCVAS